MENKKKEICFVVEPKPQPERLVMYAHACYKGKYFYEKEDSYFYLLPGGQAWIADANGLRKAYISHLMPKNCSEITKEEFIVQAHKASKKAIEEVDVLKLL